MGKVVILVHPFRTVQNGVRIGPKGDLPKRVQSEVMFLDT